ncbi:MAG: DUF3465 domain-containing protein [Candidatus Omnitrophota bacterium]
MRKKIKILCFSLFFLSLCWVLPGCAQKTGISLSSENQIAQAFQKGESNFFVESKGTVEKLLSDDEKGSRHQRFLLRLNNGHVILIAHNIDLAPRVDLLKAGDEVSFRGEYEWNNKGGVVHWTHYDPKGRKGGWLEHGGHRYQ